MKIKKLIKRLGRAPVILQQENRDIAAPSVLIVDNGHSWLGQLDSGIERVKTYFSKAKISVLTWEDRKCNLESDFPGLDYNLPSQKLWPKKYSIALRMLPLRKIKYDYVILFSLDMTPIIVSLFFFHSKVMLYNQWQQWWSLRLRNVNELFKITYVKRKTRSGLKSILSRIGLYFVLLQRKSEDELKHSILVVDNGRAALEHIDGAIQQLKDSLPLANISILALEQRRKLDDKFVNVEHIQAGKFIVKEYGVARHMLRLRKNRYDYVVLLSLDITPIFVSLGFMKAKVLLYNQWHQWWSLRLRPLNTYLIALFKYIGKIFIFIYLLFSVSWIFTKRLLNVLKLNPFKEKM